ncbi:membrane protease YdiL (CAAX protease family) [Cytobacillus eiseniae]|uniref:Membrane protease YdiL (CAAX protease family) n=1 Tax=Cytobacillus eiseniae TaxID=762947 RepID=A0ABS4RBE3_9BACI|nr:CPBP family intramembrane glutamic endopeptidase [Cytobacillus eiseniae]MBP2240223.1 membrane protease YdiL (CAAX protease family) [Cytobacillus eiseniae]
MKVFSRWTINKNLALFIILTVGLLFIGSVCTAIIANKYFQSPYFMEYESLLLAGLFLLFSVFLYFKGKYVYIYTIFIYLFFFSSQILMILGLLHNSNFFMYTLSAIYLLVSILFIIHIKNIDIFRTYHVTKLSNLIISIILIFVFEISVTLFIFLRSDLIQKLIFSIPSDIIYVIPWNLLTSTISLCGCLLIIRYIMKMRIKDLFREIGIFSIRDFKIGFIVIIIIIVLLQIEGVFINLFFEYPYSAKYVTSNSWKESLTFFLDFLGVGMHEEIIYRGFLFYTVYCAIDKNKQSLFNLIMVIILSQALFSVSHLPRMLILFDFYSILDIILGLLQYFAFGIFFLICYIRTKSIYAVIFIHTLYNYGGTQYSVEFLGFLASHAPFTIFFVITLLLFWDHIPRVRNRKTRKTTYSNETQTQT